MSISVLNPGGGGLKLAGQGPAGIPALAAPIGALGSIARSLPQTAQATVMDVGLGILKHKMADPGAGPEDLIMRSMRDFGLPLAKAGAAEAIKKLKAALTESAKIAAEAVLSSVAEQEGSGFIPSAMRTSGQLLCCSPTRNFMFGQRGATPGMHTLPLPVKKLSFA